MTDLFFGPLSLVPAVQTVALMLSWGVLPAT